MLDFTYLPRLRAGNSKVYQQLERAARDLVQHMQSFTFARAKANGKLPESIVAFCTALDVVEKILGMKTSSVADTLHKLRDSHDPRAFWAGSLLLCGRAGLSAGSNTKRQIARTRRSVMSLLMAFRAYGDKTELWHDVTTRVRKYMEAILAALRPATVADEAGDLRAGQPVPRWDKHNRTLWLSNKQIKRYTRPAPLQTRILDAFQEDGWPPQIDDPLDPGMLRRVLDSLNKTLRLTPLHFHGDGTGEGVWWSIRDIAGS
jgi:hypothetical protein